MKKVFETPSKSLLADLALRFTFFQADAPPGLFLMLCVTSVSCCGTLLCMRRALIVSHDRATQMILAGHSRKAGFEAVVASTLAEAERWLSPQHRFEMVFVEWQMPDGMGLELLPLIHSASTKHSVFTIATSADLGAGDIVRVNRAKCNAAGFDGFLAKPIIKDECRQYLSCCALSEQGKHGTDCSRPE